MRHPNGRRAGISLVELLVVTAVVGAVVAFALPAVQKAREAANRAKCQNNLRQVALAFHGYHAAAGHYPPGGKDGADPPVSDPAAVHGPSGRAEWSWPWFLLPHLGEQPVYDLPDTADGNAAVGRAVVAAFVCPSRRSARLYSGASPLPDGGDPVDWPPHAVSDYAANAGAGTTFPKSAAAKDYTGVVVRTGLGEVRAADVTDGLSSTLLVGEKRMTLGRFGASLDDNDPPYSPGWETDVVRFARHDPVDPDDPGAAVYDGPAADLRWGDGFGGLDRFGSSHPAGMNAALCDGSVRVVRYSENNLAFARLCTRARGTTFNPDDL